MGVSPLALMAVPCPPMASTPPMVMSPGAGLAVRPSPAAPRVDSRVSMVTPAWAVTVAGDPDLLTEMPVRCCVVSTSR